MRAIQYSLLTLLGVIAVVAVAVAALRVGDWFWCRILFTLTLALNLGALLGCAYRSDRQRAFWIGFALFGWSCWLIMNLPALRIAEYQIFARALDVMVKDHVPAANEGIVIDPNGASIAIFSFRQSLYSAFGLLFSVLGGIIGLWFCTTGKTGSNPDQARAAKPPPN
jgi:hypothetical protein